MAPRSALIHWLRALTACVVLAAPARAATTPPGLNLRWDNCFGDGGVSNKLFACNTNAGTDRLVLSFVLDTPMSDVSGVEIRIEFRSASPSVPSWWQFKSPGTCRQTALTLDTALSPVAANCLDWSDGQSTGGIGAYSPSGLIQNMMTLLAAAAVPASGLETLVPGQEYFVANLKLDHSKTVGTGSCTGCELPMCVVFSTLRITTPVSANDRKLISGANGVTSLLATWQNGLVVNPHVVNTGVNSGGDRMSMDECILDPLTPTMRSTWGSVKALYR